MKAEMARGLETIPLVSGAPPRGEGVEEVWREESFRRLVEFSGRMRRAMPVSVERLRTLLAAGKIHDVALRGAMRSLNLGFDRMLLMTGAFIEGGGYALPASAFLRREVATLVELGLVQVAHSGPPDRGWVGLTRRGQQLAVYAIYRIFVAAAENGSPHE
jgi:hypothetical protein